MFVSLHQATYVQEREKEGVPLCARNKYALSVVRMKVLFLARMETLVGESVFPQHCQ